MIIVPFIQQMVRIDLRTRVLDVPPQDVISKDNVSVKVNAVVYFRVVDPEKAVTAERLAQAGEILARRPEAMQLRYLSTLLNIAGERSSTIVFPLPMNLASSLSPARKTPSD